MMRLAMFISGLLLSVVATCDKASAVYLKNGYVTYDSILHQVYNMRQTELLTIASNLGLLLTKLSVDSVLATGTINGWEFKLEELDNQVHFYATTVIGKGELGELPISFSLVFDTEKLLTDAHYLAWAKQEIQRYARFQGD